MGRTSVGRGSGRRRVDEGAGDVGGLGKGGAVEGALKKGVGVGATVVSLWVGVIALVFSIYTAQCLARIISNNVQYSFLPPKFKREFETSVIDKVTALNTEFFPDCDSTLLFIPGLPMASALKPVGGV